MRCFIILAFCLVITASVAQRRTTQILKVRHVRGSTSFDIGGGVSGYGILGNVYLTQFFIDNTYWKVGGGYEYKLGKGDIKYSSVFADALVGHTVLNKGTVFANVLGGATVAMDQIDNIDTTKDKGGVVYGPVIGGEFEFYFTNKVEFVITGTQSFILNKSDNDRWYLGASLRFKI